MTRDAEHTPSPQSVVVPVAVLNEAAGVLDCEGYGPLSMSLLSCLSAPAPSSLAGGEVTNDQIQSVMLAAIKEVRATVTDATEGACMDADIIRMERGTVDMGDTGWAVMRAVHRRLAALSPEAPEPAVLVRDRFGTILDHLTTAPEGWELRRVTEAPAREGVEPWKEGREEGRLAARPWRKGDPVPAVGTMVLVSGAHGDIESDQHRAFQWRRVIGYGVDGADFICLQNKGCWPTVERMENCWFAALTPRHEAPADHHEQNLTASNAELTEQALSHPPLEVPAEGAGEAAIAKLFDAVEMADDYNRLSDRPKRLAKDFLLDSELRDAVSSLRARSSAPEAREGEAAGWRWRFDNDLSESMWFYGHVVPERPENAINTIVETQPLYTHPSAPSADKLRIAVETLETERSWHERVADFAFDDAREASERQEETDEATAMRRMNAHNARASIIDQALAALKAEGAK
ncbi:hypothetical protein D3C72_469210 [compost metagenome]